MPISREARRPCVPDKTPLVDREEELRQKQNLSFDRQHRARDLSPVLAGDLVWLPDRREQGIIGGEIALCSYQVKTPSRTFRRNRRGIIRLPVEEV